MKSIGFYIIFFGFFICSIGVKTLFIDWLKPVNYFDIIWNSIGYALGTFGFFALVLLIVANIKDIL